MREPLSPISSEFFHKYLLYGNSLNIAMTVQIGNDLDRDLVSQALHFVMLKHPILRSRVAIDLDSPFRYFWEPLQEQQSIPLFYEELRCHSESLQQELSALETLHHNQTIPCDRTYPFQLFITSYDRSFTHLQFMMPHAAGDGKSLAICVRDLLDFYSQLEAGKTPVFEPLQYFPGDWEELFGYSVDSKKKESAERLLNADLEFQNLPNRDRYGDERDWPNFAGDLQHKQSPQKQALTLIPFPRPLISESQHITDGFSSLIKTLHYTFPQEQVSKLKALRKNPLYQTDSGLPYSINDLVSALYVQLQLKLARIAGEEVQFVVLGMAFDLRSFFSKTVWKSAVQDIYLPMVIELKIEKEMSENLCALLKVINLQKDNALKKMPRLSLEPILLRSQLGNSLTQDDWSLFLKFRSEMMQKKISRILRLSYMGNINSFFKNLQNFNFLKADFKTTIAGFPVPSLLLYSFNRELSLTYPYVPEFFNESEVEMVWQMMIEAIEELCNAN
ncbi:hypothetical protein TUMEXPCC7403_01410 [Tumidithrix helvetica PCC 7403]|uniref:condensation domain-containing protein n=1 Tax=Tumidithrix helvetica TaxID=3457545 RepID=UPI003CC2ED11